MNIPLTNFRGTLRQISPKSLNDAGKALLRASAPKFLAISDEKRHEIFEELSPKMDSNISMIYVQALPYRRYSGDYFADAQDEYRLDAGSYYSVCNDEKGTDYGTLAEELNAYRDPQVGFYTLFFDCLNPEMAQSFGLPVSAHIGVIIFQPARLAKAIGENAPSELRASLNRALKHNKPFGMTLGVVLAEAEIAGVLDLRLIEAQDWFFNAFVPKGPIPTQASRFIEILPELLQPALGGSIMGPEAGSNVRLQYVGAWLRQQGVNALIYPSARTDVGASYLDGQLKKWRGWNLVMYKGKAPRSDQHYDLGGWETVFRNGASFLQREIGGKNSYEWWVAGLTAINHAGF